VFQIVCFAFVFRFTALYATPGYVGIDIWTHQGFVDAILTEQSLSGISHDKHYGSPFYHLLVAASSLLYDVPIRAALYLSVGLVMPLAALLVYSTTNLLVPVRWAVLATALYAFSSHVARWGMHIIPTSLGLVFFLGMLYALIRVMRIEYTIRDFSLLLLMSVAVILTHQVSTFIMLVLLLAAFLAQVVFVIGPLGLTRLDTSVFRTKKPVNPRRTRRLQSGADDLRLVAHAVPTGVVPGHGSELLLTDARGERRLPQYRERVLVRRR